MSIEAEAYPRQGLAVPAANSDRNSQIVITVTPDRAPGRYRAHLETELKPLCVSCQPFFDGARTLIARGHGPRTMLVMRWAGSKGWMLRGPLVVAAKLTVDEHNGTVFAKWKPLSRSAGSPRIAKSADTGSRDQRLLNAIADSTAENAGERAPLARRLVKSADPHPTTEKRALIAMAMTRTATVLVKARSPSVRVRRRAKGKQWRRSTDCEKTSEHKRAAHHHRP